MSLNVFVDESLKELTINVLFVDETFPQIDFPSMVFLSYFSVKNCFPLGRKKNIETKSQNIFSTSPNQSREKGEFQNFFWDMLEKFIAGEKP